MSNDNMNDLIAEARRWANGHPNRRSGELMRELADALEAATCERAAVPDAATEELRADEMTANEAIGLVLKRPGMYGLVPLGEHRSVKAERDAALVAAQGAAPQQIGRLDLARHYWRSQGYDYDLHGLDGNSDYEMGLAVADAALAALAAAQGAAPQAGEVQKPTENDQLPAESSISVLPSSTAPQAEAYVHCCNHPKCPGGSLCCCVSEQRLRDGWNQWREEVAGDAKQAFRDGYQAGQNDPAPWHAPVLPSSVVDVAKIESLIMGRTATAGARAVAEWLGGGAR